MEPKWVKGNIWFSLSWKWIIEIKWIVFVRFLLLHAGDYFNVFGCIFNQIQCFCCYGYMAGCILVKWKSQEMLWVEKKTVEMLHKINLFLFGFSSAALITPSHFFTFWKYKSIHLLIQLWRALIHPSIVKKLSHDYIKC